VQKLVIEAPIGRSFGERIDVFRATQEIVFRDMASVQVTGERATGVNEWR
jgi:hypothetical protein